MDIGIKKDSWGRPSLVIEYVESVDSDRLYDLFLESGGTDYRSELEDAEERIEALETKIEELGGVV